VGAAGAAAARATGCGGSYGAGQSNFGYQDVLTVSDPVFHLSRTAQDNALSADGQHCVPTTVISRPAQYETNRCSKTAHTDAETCTQELAVAITTSHTPATPGYYCPEGELQGTYCVRTTTSPASVTYWCPGGTLSGTLCINSSASPATVSYTCPDGATLSGTTCIGLSGVPATPMYTCSVGTYDGQGCTSTTAAVGVPSCPAPIEGDIYRWVLHDGGWCEYYNALSGTVSIQKSVVAYSCPDGGTPSGSTCTNTTTATLNYQCDRGTLSGSNCIVAEDGPAMPAYSCGTGTLSGTQCITSGSAPAIPGYHCPAGQTLNGALCEATTTGNAPLHYSCPGGVRPVGDQCRTVLTQLNWTDNCLPYEQSAGITLGAPK
jgi:hypothetical protein